jgi:hypothetical protein
MKLTGLLLSAGTVFFEMGDDRHLQSKKAKVDVNSFT